MKIFVQLLLVVWLFFATFAGFAGAATPVVVAGDKHSCALTSTGKVLCWGSNAAGQLGDDTQIDRATPVPVVGVTNAVKLAAGGDRTCAILDTAEVRCWGWTQVYYDLDPINNKSPGANYFQAIAVSVEGNQTCIVRVGGRVLCVRKEPTYQQQVSVDISGVEDAVDIVSNGGRTCALLSSGKVQCWGSRSKTLFGAFSYWEVVREHQPTLIDGLSDAVQLSTLDTFTCAVRRTGTIQCWGDFVGLQDPSPMAGIENAAQVHLGIGGQNCAVLKSGELYCARHNEYGQLGTGNKEFSPTPVKVPLSGSATTVGLGLMHSCAALANGLVQCWGSSPSGQLGTGIIDLQPQPLAVASLRDAVDVSVGETHSCAVLRDGSIACWGQNENGKLGDGTYTDRSYPVPVIGIHNATAVAAGRYHSCALLRDRTVKCWGRNISGQLGTGDFNDTLEGVTVVGLTDVIGLVAGSSHTCAVRGQGDVLCWGSNIYQSLGITYAPISGQYGFSTPQLVLGIPKALSISARGFNNCTLDIAGEVHCWGDVTARTFNGRWDDGAGWREDIPTIAIMGGECALSAWGTVWCGLGLKSPPVLTALVKDVAQLSGNCMALTDGTVRCWDGRTWVAKLGIADAVRVSANYGSACAVLATGRVKCWGKDTNGQLGLGLPSGLSPQKVAGAGGNATLDLQDVNLTLTVQQADIVFAFAELSAPQIFEAIPRPSFTVDGLRVREFANGHYLGVNLEGTPYLYYKGPQSNNTVLNLGLLSGWLGLSKM